MNKLTTAAILSLAGLGLNTADAFGWGCCGTGCTITHKVVCSQYNAFSPWCCVPVAKKHGLFHKKCCGTPGMHMQCYQCPQPCHSGGCQTGCCEGSGSGYVPGVPQRMPGATNAPEAIPTAPMPSPAQTMGMPQGYPMMPQGGYPMMAQGGYPMMPQGGYPMMPQGGYPMMPQGGYPMMAQGGYPMQPMMMPAGMPMMPQGGYPMNPMMAQGGGYPMQPMMGQPGMMPQYPQSYPAGYYPPPNQALIAPPGTQGMPPTGFPASMPMQAQ